MLSLVNNYGLSHVCANQEFENVEIGRNINYNFPYLDMYLKEEYLSPSDWPDLTSTEFSIRRSIEFFLRGTKDKDWEFQNLFEFLFWIRYQRSGLKYLFVES